MVASLIRGISFEDGAIGSLILGEMRPSSSFTEKFSDRLLGYAPARNLRYARLPKLALRALWAEPRQGAIYSPEGFARLAAKVLSGSLVLPR